MIEPTSLAALLVGGWCVIGFIARARAVRPHTAELGLIDGIDTFRHLDRHEDADRSPA